MSDLDIKFSAGDRDAEKKDDIKDLNMKIKNGQLEPVKTVSKAPKSREKKKKAMPARSILKI